MNDHLMKHTRSGPGIRLGTVLSTPELNVLLFAFLLNYPWEFIQTPMYKGLAAMPHWEAVQGCTQATVGDAVIMLIAFWGVALLRRDRAWITFPTLHCVLQFYLIGRQIRGGTR